MQMSGSPQFFFVSSRNRRPVQSKPGGSKEARSLRYLDAGEFWFTKDYKRSPEGRLGGADRSELRPMMSSKEFYKKARQSMSVRSKIVSVMRQVAEEQKVTLPPLDDDLSLHETGFDSLAFAIVVARLEDDLGVDPFTLSEDATFPLTIGDLVQAYENVHA
jgi:acyl carrier protein